MNERDCQILLTVFEEMNVTKAAERLYITQPALTYRLQQMEREFSIKIFQKQGKNIQLTAEGEYLVEFAAKTKQELTRFKETILSIRKEGVLRLGVSSHFTQYLLPTILNSFLEEFPQVQFNLLTASNQSIMHLLQNGDIHIGIVRGDFNWFDQKYLLMDEPSYLISKQAIEFNDLPRLPRIDYRSDNMPLNKFGYKPNTLLAETIESWWKGHFAEPPFVAMSVNNYDTCKELVKNGLGYSIIPQLCLRPDDNFHLMKMIWKNGSPLTRRTWLIYKETSLDLYIVDAFVKYIKSFDLISEMKRPQA